MASTKYTKSIISDFSGLTEDAPCPDHLGEEIQNSAITIALDYISISGDTVDIWFKDALSSGEQTILTAVVAAHTGYAHTTDILLAEDGKQYVSPDLFPTGYFLVYSGSGDDITNGVKWAGPRFKSSTSEAGTDTVEWQYMEHTLLAGGSVYRMDGGIDDYIDMEINAPATAGSSNPGAGAYDKYAVGGGINIFVPNATNEGDWDINLTETLNANVAFTKAVPVPASGGNTGWFDYNEDTNVLTFNALHKGGYNLFDAVIPLSHHVSKAPLLGEGKACTAIAAVKPVLALPHWTFKVVVTHGAGANVLQTVWKLLIGRKSTT